MCVFANRMRKVLNITLRNYKNIQSIISSDDSSLCTHAASQSVLVTTSKVTSDTDFSEVVGSENKIDM